MATDQEVDLVIHVLRIPLGFLLSPAPRTPPRGMDGLSASRIFYLLWDRTDHLSDARIAARCDRTLVEVHSQFITVMKSLPWQQCPQDSGAKELPDDDLAPLVEPGRRLLAEVDRLSPKA